MFWLLSSTQRTLWQEETVPACPRSVSMGTGGSHHGGEQVLVFLQMPSGTSLPVTSCFPQDLSSQLGRKLPTRVSLPRSPVRGHPTFALKPLP